MKLPLIDRIQYAQRLSAGKKVLDIGGQKMPGCDHASPFAIAYAAIQKSASEYRIVDYQNRAEVNYVLDLNEPASVARLSDVIMDYQPDVILCMETLEHINCHFEVMNTLADAVTRSGVVVFITIPNNGNWVFNALGWNSDHSIAFFRDIAWRFITRSRLGQHDVTMVACMQRYIWYWWLVYLLSFGQPFSWGFCVQRRSGN
jgi:hypothetical protein